MIISIKSCIVSMCCRPMKLRPWYRRMDVPQTARTTYTKKIYKDTLIVLYEYQGTRKAEHPREFLKVFTEVVVCDGYSAYRKQDRENPDITFAGCWIHVRRYFSDSLKALPKAVQKLRKIPLHMKL